MAARGHGREEKGQTMKTINERAKEAIERSAPPPHFPQWWAIAIAPEQTEWLIKSIENSLRELAQDCAKLADKHEAEMTLSGTESKMRGAGLSSLGHAFEAVAAKVIADNIRTRFCPAPEKTELEKLAAEIWSGVNDPNKSGEEREAIILAGLQRATQMRGDYADD
jgi:hypothetical protein